MKDDSGDQIFQKPLVGLMCDGQHVANIHHRYFIPPSKQNKQHQLQKKGACEVKHFICYSGKKQKKTKKNIQKKTHPPSFHPPFLSSPFFPSHHPRSSADFLWVFRARGPDPWWSSWSWPPVGGWWLGGAWRRGVDVLLLFIRPPTT